jgi:hypothetical protein
LPSKLVNTDQASSYCGRTEFGNVDGNHVRAATDTETCEYTTTDDQTESSVTISS